MKTIAAIISAVAIFTVTQAQARHRHHHPVTSGIIYPIVNYNHPIDLGACPTMPYQANHDMLCDRQMQNDH